MKYSNSGYLALLALTQLAFAKEISNPAKQWEYESGQVHETLMGKKYASWDAKREQGLFDSTQYKSYSAEAGPVACVDGVAAVIPGDANYTFRCNNIDFYDFQSHADLGSSIGEGAGSWGWTSPEGREFVAIAQNDGAAFAEVSAEGRLVYLGRLPQYTTAQPSLWREIKGYRNYMVIGSEAYYHGVQIFDMAKLLTVDPAAPVVFSNDADLTGHFDGLPVGRSHNVVVNEERGYAVAVGAQPRNSSCAAGLIFIDLADPSAPTSPGCAAGDGYVHDAQCLVYRGPDEQYVGTEVCYGYDEDTLTIFDVTDKNTTRILSRTSYDGASYTHQGWVLDVDWQQFLLLDDEYDEYDGAGEGAAGFPVTYIWDVSELAAPKLVGSYHSGTRGIDHNQYVVDGWAYQSNYGTGLRILDISSIPQDPTGAGVKEVAFFDIYPEDDEAEDGGIVDFSGTWSHYPYFKSGFTVVNTIERGAYVLKRTDI